MYCKLTNICVYACMYCINTIIDETCEEGYIVMCINYILASYNQNVQEKLLNVLVIYCMVL